MTIGVGCLLVFVSAFAQTPQSTKVVEVRASHTNDADFLNGNDFGFTFRNRIDFRAFDSKDPAKLDTTIRAETEFFTEPRPDPDYPGYTEFAPNGHPRINYFERTRLSCSWREWDPVDGAARTFVGHCVEVRHDTSNETDTGSRLQDSVHKRALPPDSTSIYAYDKNRFELNRTSVGVGVETGIVWRPTSLLESESSIHCKFQSESLRECTWGAETSLRLRPPVEWGNERDRREPLWAFYVKGEFEQDFDFKGCDLNLRYGVEAAIGLGGNKRLLLDVSCTKPIDIDPSQDRGIARDRDNLIEIGFGVSF